MKQTIRFLSITLLVLLQTGCNSSTEPGAVVTIRFSTPSTGGGAAPPGVAADARGSVLDIVGTNGILTLDDLRLIVNEFELERVNVPDEDDDDGGSSNDGDHEEFEAPPAFVQVPLIDGETPVVQHEVPPGVYSEFEFEVENLDEDPRDDDFNELISLLMEIREQFPDWPPEASMLVTGTFTPTTGTPAPFRAFFEAEIEIEMEFSSPLIVEADAMGVVVDVVVDPRLWFLRGDGTVMDLSQFDFDTTGEIVELEFEMENGFTEIEFDS